MRVSLSLLLPTLAFVAPASASDAPRVPFVENFGQLPPSVAFHAQTRDGALSVLTTGELQHRLGRAVALERFVGGAALARPGRASACEVSYFLGADPSLWRQRAPACDEVLLGEVWSGVQVELVVRGGDVEKLFRIAPRARAECICVELGGALEICPQADGALALELEAGSARLTPPRAWQIVDGERIAVEVAYRVVGNRYGFEVGAYDPTRELWIDPILQSTYLGSNANFGGFASDRIDAMAIDATTGAVYVAGQTISPTFPGVATGAFPTAPGGAFNVCGFVARLTPGLGLLTRATYFGGTLEDKVYGIAVNAAGVYICGSTTSTDLPVLGAAQAAKLGDEDGFVALFNHDLTALIASTYHGCVDGVGAGDDLCTDIELDAGGDVFVVGTVDGVMSATTGAARATPILGRDAYVSRLSANLASVVRTCYVGSSDIDVSGGTFWMTRGGLALGGGRVFVIGAALGGSDLLSTLGISGFQNLYGGSFSDAFVVALNPTLTTFLGGTYYGGFDTEIAVDGVVAPNGDLLITGVTSGIGALPGTASGAQTAAASTDDEAFVARFTGNLGALSNATYLGGVAGDYGQAIALHPLNGDVYVAGHSVTFTTLSSFPALAGGAQPVARGGYNEAFLARLNPALTTFVQSTFVGGNSQDQGYALALHGGTGEVYVAGVTGSANLSGIAGGADVDLAGQEGFIARLDEDLSYGGPVTYCSAGVTTNGCSPSISATASPSASLAGPCSINVSGVEGQKSGLIFYSVSGPQSLSWCGSSTSFLCVKTPTQRTPAANSGGVAGMCNGALSLNWNAFHTTNPGALGTPFAIGSAICAQGWFRDPPACKGTNLSNGVYAEIQP